MFTPLEIIVKDGVTTTTGALKMMETDPHGFTLSIVAISVVFSCLIILFCIYSLMGAIFTGKFRRKSDRSSEDGLASSHVRPSGSSRLGVAEPPIHMAMGGHADSDATHLSGTKPEEIAAAIGLALHLYLGGNHDVESGFITIDNQYPTAWADKGRGFRKTPVRQ